ncbi:MAG: hypothetical protein ACFE8V_14850 [Promethearchaeota archaeon]
MGYIHIKELQNSAKFGRVLPIDFDNQIHFFPTEEIFNEIKDYFTNEGSPDYIWLKGINDINYFFGFSRLLNKIKETFPMQKIGVYVNSSLFNYENVRISLLICDLVVINLNSVNPSNFHKACACSEDTNVQDILNGIKLFRNDFKGTFSIFTMFLKDINDNLNDVIDLRKFLLEVKPDHFSVNVFTGKGFESISDEFKDKVKDTLNNLPFEVSFTF